MNDKAKKGRAPRPSGARLPFGVFFDKRNTDVRLRFWSGIKYGGKRIYLGTFSTIQQANFIAVEAWVKLRILGFSVSGLKLAKEE
jgi:hypothetical protein